MIPKVRTCRGDKVLELAITIACSISFNRNQVRHGQSCQSAAVILRKARSLIDEFQVANFRPSLPIVKEMEIWVNPKPPWYKVNIDGAVFQQ